MNPTLDSRLRVDSPAPSSSMTHAAFSAPRTSNRLPLVLIWLGSLFLASGAIWSYWHAQAVRAYFVDEGIYTYIGWSWFHGQWPYRDVWDHKGPTVYLTTMARAALAGTNARYLGAQEIAIGLMMASCLAGIAGVLWGRIGPPLALIFGVLVWAQRPLVDFGTSSADPAHVHMSTPGSLIALFSTAAILFALRAVRHERSGRAVLMAVLSGVCGGLAVATKLNAVAGFVVALGVLAFGDRERMIQQRLGLVLLALLGSAVPTAAFAGLFYAVGAYSHFVDAYFLFNSIRGGLGFSPADWAFLPVQIARNLHYAGIATTTAVVLLASAFAAIPARFRKVENGLVLQAVEVLVPVWLLLELGVWLTNGGAYAFRVYPVLPAAALGATWLVVAITRSAAGWAIGGLAFLLLIGSSAISLDPLHARARQVVVDWAGMVRDLARTTDDTDRILSLNSWRAPSIMSLVQRRSASRYIFPQPLATQHYASDERWGEILDIVKSPTSPRVILLGRTGAGLGEEPHPTLERALETLDHPDVRSALVDRTQYPNLELVKLMIAAQYSLKYCADEICLLRKLE